MRKKDSKVVALGDKKQAAMEQQAAWIAEAAAKDNPSAESRAWVDSKFDADPSWAEYGDLAAEAMDLALRNFWLGYITKEGVRRAAEALKTELGFEDASPPERILVDHAVLCHVRLGMVEHLYSRNTSGRMDVIEHWERRLTMAQKRFTRAVTALARVRGLLARAEAAREAARRASSARSLAVLKQVAG